VLDGPTPQELPICRPKVAYKGSRTDSKFSIVRLGCIQGEQISTRRLFEMILDVLTIFLLIQCANMISRLIGRRRQDVLYYVSKSDPHR
jgi:hypothetical protein